MQLLAQQLAVDYPIVYRAQRVLATLAAIDGPANEHFR